MARTIFEALKTQVASNGDRPAILTPGKRDLAFSDLGHQVEYGRRVLARYGIGRGSRVGILVSTRDCTVTAYLAVISCATAVPLSVDSTAFEIENTLRRCRADSLVVDVPNRESILDSAMRAGVRNVITLTPEPTSTGRFELHGEERSGQVRVQDPEPDDLIVVLQTSGTTGGPKVVPLTQGSRASELEQVYGEIRATSEDRNLAALPLHHGQGLLAEAQIPLVLGASVAIIEFEPHDFISAVKRTGATMFTLAPSMHQAALAAERGREGVLGGTRVRFARSATAALTTQVRRELETLYGVPVLNNYASTEGGFIARDDVPASSRREGSVGRAVHTGVAILDEQGNPVATGSPGEICVQAPTVMSGYENDPEANARVFCNGWLRTGDLGYFDDDGFLFLTGRLAESINRGGEMVSPDEVDEVLTRHPLVAQAAAFGISHPTLGQEVAAAIVPIEGANVTAAEIRSFSSADLSFEKVPKQIYFMETLPTGGTGKVQRDRLEQITGDHD